MKNLTFVKRAALISLVLVASASMMFLVAASGTDRAPRAVRQRPQSPPDQRTLREKAKEARNFVGTEGPESTPQLDGLGAVTALSTDIVIGEAVTNACRLSADGKRVTIDYTVRVGESRKGSLRPGDTITVSLPGGRVSFEDGSTAEVRTPWFRKMENGKTYVLFLGGGAGVQFVIAGGPQGLFEVSKADGTVKTHSGRLKDPVWKYNGMGLQRFLVEAQKGGEKN